MSDAQGDRDLSQPDPRLEGWGGNDDAQELSDEQAAALQQREEPVAAADFGLPLTGDLGRAEVASESVDAPETTEPDTSLGHEGGKRYEDYADGAGGSA
jgi:hypothetical protein